MNYPAPSFRKSVSTRLLCGIGVAALMSMQAAHAWAQTPPAPDAAAAGASGAADAVQNLTDAAAEDDNAIQVIGSIIRGVAPTGSNVSVYNKADLDRTGLSSMTEVLSQLPMFAGGGNANAGGGFGQLGATNGASNKDNSIILRAGLEGSGSPATLVLIDGHAAVGTGILNTGVDVGAIPSAALERVDVMADGGASLYGSDAVGGVVNFVTRRSFEGVQVEVHDKFRTGRRAIDTSIITGQKWDNGGYLVTWAQRMDSGIMAVDTVSYQPRDLRPQLGNELYYDRRSTSCVPGNISFPGNNNQPNRTFYPVQTRILGSQDTDTVNECDTNQYAYVLPKEHATNLLFSGFQELSDTFTLDMKASYSYRNSLSSSGPITVSYTVNANNPWFRPIGGEPNQAPATFPTGGATTAAVATHTVNTNLSPIYGDANFGSALATNYSITPTLTYKMPWDWQAKLLLNYGHSYTLFTSGLTANTATLNAATQPMLAPTTAQITNKAALYINPYDLTQTSKILFNSIYKPAAGNYAYNTLENAKLNMDGPLFDIPGGKVRAGIVLEHKREWLSGFFSTGASVSTGSRQIDSMAVQISVPLIGRENALPFVRALALDLSGRMDRYSNFGLTTNPSISASWTIIDGLKLRGKYSSSFVAPGLGATAGSDGRYGNTNNGCLNNQLGINNQALLCGTMPGPNPNLNPETAQTYSVGVDYSPSFVPGLTVTATYWNINFQNQVVTPGTQATALLNLNNPLAQFAARPDLAQFLLLAPNPGTATCNLNPAACSLTKAQVIAFSGGIEFPVTGSNYGTTLDDVFANAVSLGVPAIGYLIDQRRFNYNRTVTDGVDFSVRYNHGFGPVNVFGSLQATYTLSLDTQLPPLPTGPSPIIDTIHYNAALNTGLNRTTISGTATFGARYMNLTASATVLFSNYEWVSDSLPGANTSFPTTGSPPGPGATNVKLSGWENINLAFIYNVGGEGLGKDLDLMLNIDNAFDRAPDSIRLSPQNFNTLGRVYNVGVRKKF